MDSKQVVTSAPAKVILFGEHLVVHGATALTTALDLRTFCKISSISNPNRVLHLILPDIGVNVEIPLNDIIQYDDTLQWDSPPKSVNESLMEKLEKICSSNKGVVAVLFLISSIAGLKLENVGSISIQVKSEFQPGVGLGSSAAFSVAIAAAAFKFFDIWTSTGYVHPQVDIAARGWKDIHVPPYPIASLINQWAYAAETIMHGKPSGIDNSISTFGGAVAFQSGNISIINQVPSLKLAITNTKVPRSTKTLVSNVGILRKTFPSVFDPIIQSVEQISQSTLKIFSTYCSTTDTSFQTELEEQLNGLIDVNQGLLCTIGVGHPSLDQVVSIGKKHGFHSKLTGAGGGGCAITFLPTNSVPEQVAGLKQDMASVGYDCFDAKIGAAGVISHDKYPIETDS